MFRMRVLLATLLVGAWTLAPASAASRYAYWSYWQSGSAGWEYAQVGPAAAPAVDGAVDGWRFTVAEIGAPEQPSERPTFAAICAGTPAQEGRVRMGLVIDDGTGAVRRACAVTAAGTTRVAALDSVTELRFASSGLLCAIDGYPAEGCGEPVVDEPAQELLPMVVTAVLATITLLLALRNARRQRGEA